MLLNFLSMPDLRFVIRLPNNRKNNKRTAVKNIMIKLKPVLQL